MSDDTVDLWALDEVHFQQQGSRCRMWIPPEIRDPVVYHHPTRKSVGYLRRCACETADSCFGARPDVSTANPSLRSLSSSGKQVPWLAAASSRSATMHKIIAPNAICHGVNARSH